MVLPWLHGPHRDRLINRWSVHILSILNVKVEVAGNIPPSDSPPALFVSNHISWLDVWAINSVRTVRFVAKSEVRSWPLIGWLSEKAGVIFIERARRLDTSRVSGAGANALRQGHCLCVFPEGTTSNGTYLHPFRSSLLQSAVETGAPVRPIALQYPLLDGRPNTDIAYAGDTSLVQSIMTILAQKEITLKLTFAEPIHTTGRDRRELVKEAETAIALLVRLPVLAAPEIFSGPPA